MNNRICDFFIKNPEVGLIVGGIILLTLGICSSPANAAEGVPVSFNDEDHLIALQDSVVGVCDTTGGHYTSWITNPRTGDKWGIDSSFVETVTCRRLVGVTARWPEKTDTVWGSPFRNEGMTDEEYKKLCDRFPEPGCPVITPGQAIIFYEEVKR